MKKETMIARKKKHGKNKERNEGRSQTKHGLKQVWLIMYLKQAIFSGNAGNKNFGIAVYDSSSSLQKLVTALSHYETKAQNGNFGVLRKTWNARVKLFYISVRKSQKRKVCYFQIYQYRRNVNKLKKKTKRKNRNKTSTSFCTRTSSSP